MGHPNPYVKPLVKAAKTGGLEGLNAEHRKREAALERFAQNVPIAEWELREKQTQLAAAYDRVHFTIVPRPYRDGRFTDEDTGTFAEFGFFSEVYTSESGYGQRKRLVFRRGGNLVEVNARDTYARDGSDVRWHVTSVNWKTESVTLRRSNIQTTWSLGGA
jgi:hypothetical protein